MKLRTHLVLLMAGTLLPMVLLAMAGALWLIDRERSTFERGAIDRARALLTAVDSEVRNPITTLEALASQREISEGDLRAIHAELVRGIESQPDWIGLHLADPSGQQLVNAR